MGGRRIKHLAWIGGVCSVWRRGRLGAFGVTCSRREWWGVDGWGKRGCSCLLSSAKQSASLLPSMVTWEGTLTY